MERLDIIVFGHTVPTPDSSIERFANMVLERRDSGGEPFRAVVVAQTGFEAGARHLARSLNIQCITERDLRAHLVDFDPLRDPYRILLKGALPGGHSVLDQPAPWDALRSYLVAEGPPLRLLVEDDGKDMVSVPRQMVRDWTEGRGVFARMAADKQLPRVPVRVPLGLALKDGDPWTAMDWVLRRSANITAMSRGALDTMNRHGYLFWIFEGLEKLFGEEDWMDDTTRGVLERLNTWLRDNRASGIVTVASGFFEEHPRMAGTVPAILRGFGRAFPTEPARTREKANHAGPKPFWIPHSEIKEGVLISRNKLSSLGSADDYFRWLKTGSTTDYAPPDDGDTLAKRIILLGKPAFHVGGLIHFFETWGIEPDTYLELLAETGPEIRHVAHPVEDLSAEIEIWTFMVRAGDDTFEIRLHKQKRDEYDPEKPGLKNEMVEDWVTVERKRSPG